MISSAPKNSPLGGLPIRPTCRKINMEPENHPCSKGKKMIFQTFTIMFHVDFQWCILPKIHIPSFSSSKKKNSRFCGCSLSVGFPPAHCVQVQTPHLRFEQDPSTIISCWSQGIVEGWMDPWLPGLFTYMNG